MSESGHDMMRHALGWPECYRNHYCATPGTPDDETWAALEKDGMAELVRAPSDWLPYNTYRVTKAGRRVLEEQSVSIFDVNVNACMFRTTCRDRIVALEAQNERLKRGIDRFLTGDYPHPRTYRPQGECPHGTPYWQECDTCNTEFLSGLLKNE